MLKLTLKILTGYYNNGRRRILGPYNFWASMQEQGSEDPGFSAGTHSMGLTLKPVKLSLPIAKTPAPIAVHYSATVKHYQDLLESALDAVSGAQRARQKIHLPSKVPSYKEVMEMIRVHALNQPLITNIATKVLDHAKALGDLPKGLMTPPLTPQRLMLMSQVAFNPSWLSALSEGEQALLQLGSAHIYGWLDLYSAVSNGISLALFKATEKPEVDFTRLPESIRPMVTEVYQRALAHIQALRPANRYWASHPGVPYEPITRPISSTELQLLKYDHPDLYRQLMDAAPIPQSLPVLDAMQIPANMDLSKYRIVMIQHALGSLDRFIHKLKEAGAKPDDITLVPVPYSMSPIVVERLEQEKIHIDYSWQGAKNPHAIDAAMEKTVAKILDQAVTACGQDGKELLIIDDGGLAIRLLAGHAKYLTHAEDLAFRLPARTMPIKIVEQTTRGITEAKSIKDLPPNITLGNMAQSRPKILEGPSIADNVVQALFKQLDDIGKHDLVGKDVLVLGYGTIGKAVAKALSAAKANVHIYDVNSQALEQAATLYHAVDMLDEALPNKTLIVGCTGKNPVKRPDLLKISNGTVLANAASKADEFELGHLLGEHNLYESGHQTTEAPIVQSGLNDNIHRAVQVIETDPADPFHQVRFDVLNNGCPVNFMGEVNCVPPEKIQLTEATKFAMVMQVCTERDVGIVAMKKVYEDEVIALMDQHQPGWRTP